MGDAARVLGLLLQGVAVAVVGKRKYSSNTTSFRGTGALYFPPALPLGALGENKVEHIVVVPPVLGVALFMRRVLYIARQLNNYSCEA